MRAFSKGFGSTSKVKFRTGFKQLNNLILPITFLDLLKTSDMVDFSFKVDCFLSKNNGIWLKLLKTEKGFAMIKQ